jgi:hypothetical protein
MKCSHAYYALLPMMNQRLLMNLIILTQCSIVSMDQLIEILTSLVFSWKCVMCYYIDYKI